MAPSPVENTVIQELRNTGISVVHISDLLAPSIFAGLKGWAEALIESPTIREKISAVEQGARPKTKANKFYLVRPLGERPHVEIRDKVVEMSLSDPILRIVGGYFGMLGRLTALDLWYNVPTSGPDVVSQRWHRDPEDRTIVKTFLYLRDVDETNGPFCYIPRTHNGGPYKRIHRQAVGRGNYPKDGDVDRRFPPDLRRVCTGKAGTLIFCDTTGFHRGGHATGGPRVVLNAVYTTNAGTPLMSSVKQFSLAAPGAGLLGHAARYAIGHMLDEAES